MRNDGIVWEDIFPLGHFLAVPGRVRRGKRKCLRRKDLRSPQAASERKHGIVKVAGHPRSNSFPAKHLRRGAARIFRKDLTSSVNLLQWLP
jgi:hypothetical protein